MCSKRVHELTAIDTIKVNIMCSTEQRISYDSKMIRSSESLPLARTERQNHYIVYHYPGKTPIFKSTGVFLSVACYYTVIKQ